MYSIGSTYTMHPEINSFIRLPFQGTAGRKKRTFSYDAAWGRPVFRAPELIAPQVVFDPLPFRFLSPVKTFAESAKR